MGYYLGIDLGGTNTVLGIYTSPETCIYKRQIETHLTREMDLIVKDIGYLFETSLKETNIQREELFWVGVGTPGAVSHKKGVLEYYAGFLGAEKYPLKEKLQRKLNFEHILIENDANAAAYGEFVYSKETTDDTVVVVTLGTGVGAGMISNRRIYHGVNGAAGEIGHMSIDYSGERCKCGNRGCLELYASATALINQAKERIDLGRAPLLKKRTQTIKLEAKTVFDLAKEGDKDSLALLEQFTIYLSYGIANIVQVLQPKQIVIAGGMSVQTELLIDPLRKQIKKLDYAKNAHIQTKITQAKLLGDAGVYGAAFLGSQFH